jgi:hypothetical protein
MTDNTLPSSLSAIEELFSRDPLSLSEEDLLETTRLLVAMNRENVRIWNEEREKAARAGKSLSGVATRKKQHTAEQQIAMSQIDLGL